MRQLVVQCFAILLLTGLIQSSADKVMISYIEEVINREDDRTWSRFQIAAESMYYVAVGSYGSQKVITNCSISELTDEKKAWFEEQEANLKKRELDAVEFRKFAHQCATIKDALAALRSTPKLEPFDPHHNPERSRRSAIDRTDPTTVRPTFLPEGNKFFNLLIYNGTVWCGTGNKATSFDDLGYHREADQCCRAHDYCPFFITQFQTEYNYTNSRPYTISACDCDYKFYKCLVRTGTNASKEILKLFFDTIGVPCFNIEYNRYCTDDSSFFSCNNYAYGQAATLNNAISDIWKRSLSRTTLD